MFKREREREREMTVVSDREKKSSEQRLKGLDKCMLRKRSGGRQGKYMIAVFK